MATFRLQLFILWVEERHWKVLCQRTLGGDPVRLEPKPLCMESSTLTTGYGMEWVGVPIRSWKKEKKGRGGKEKRKRNIMLGNVSMNPHHLPVERISQTFHCFFPVTQATMTHSLQEFTQTQVVYEIFILEEKKVCVMNINRYNCGDIIVYFSWECWNCIETGLTPYFFD